MTPCFFLFGATSHPYIPLHFEEMTFPLFQHNDNTAFYCYSHSDVHGYVVDRLPYRQTLTVESSIDNGLLVPESGARYRIYLMYDVIRLLHVVAVSWAGFGTGQTMKVHLSAPRNTAQTLPSCSSCKATAS